MTDLADVAAHIRKAMWLGTHEVGWVTDPTMPALFISRHRLDKLDAERRRWPAVNCEAVAIDSGGFTELQKHKGWGCSVEEFAAFCARVSDWAGDRLGFIAPMDWMVEPSRLRDTGLTLADHQKLTADYYAQLIDVFIDWDRPDLARIVIPVLQGWTVDDYLANVTQYEEAGVDLLLGDRVVGVGSICRRDTRQEIEDAANVLAELADADLRIHAFGINRRAFAAAVRRDATRITPTTAGWRLDGVVSWDSLAWSSTARRERYKMEGCTHPGATCANCRHWARRWRDSFADLAEAAFADQLAASSEWDRATPPRLRRTPDGVLRIA